MTANQPADRGGVDGRPLVAVFAGPTATVLNTPRLVSGGLRPQRLVADAEVVVEGWSGHPLLGEGSWGAGGGGPRRVVLGAEDGLWLLPFPGADAGEGGVGEAQSFFPDASRLYEEVDRFGVDGAGSSGLLSGLARFEFFRAGAPGGFLSRGERLGVDFFPYGWRDDGRAEPDTAALARLTNLVQQVLGGGGFAGAQWLEGSPVVEETLYWLSLLVDTTVPIVGQVALELHQALGSDGGRNVLDGLRYLTSRCWADESGVDRVGPVVVVDSLVVTAREVVKVASRPGGYATLGVGRGVVGTVDHGREPQLAFLPTRLHTWSSQVNLSRLPEQVFGVTASGDRGGGAVVSTPVRVLDEDGGLRAEAIPNVRIVKYGRYGACGDCEDPAVEVTALVGHNLDHHPLGGFVCEGLVGDGSHELATEKALAAAAYAGFPVVRCPRGNADNHVGDLPAPFIGSAGLTANKARLLLMATMLKLGALPAARDPHHPTPAEQTATTTAIHAYQQLFNTH
jgi:L-asparaginase/Glu-tRNA(Gln) amidotransferase subunit D